MMRAIEKDKQSIAATKSKKPATTRDSVGHAPSPSGPFGRLHARVSRFVDVMDVPMAILGVLYVFVYALDVFYPSPISATIDLVLWIIFAIDVLLRFLVTNSIAKFLLNNWLEILAVLIPQFRAARAIRPLIGLKRFARVVRSRSQRLASYTVMLLPLAIFVAGVAFADVEGYGPEQFSDAMWWAIVTVSTTGFGDVIPQTDGGRIVGAALMVFGVGIFASAAAILADWIQGERADA